MGFNSFSTLTQFQHVDSVAAAPRLWSTGLIIVVHGFRGMWDLPGSEIEPMSFSLAGVFFHHWATREAPQIFWPCYETFGILVPLPGITEKALAAHSSTLAWEIPWTEEPGRLQSMASGRVGHDWSASLSLFTFMHWRRKWQPTPVFLPGESQEWEPGGLPSMGLHSRTQLTWLSSSNQGSNPYPLLWKHGVLTTGQPRKSLGFFHLLLSLSF